MPEFIAKGSVTLSNVIFFIIAETEEEAKEKFEEGRYDSYDTDTAETVDVEIKLSSVEPNE